MKADSRIALFPNGIGAARMREIGRRLLGPLADRAEITTQGPACGTE